MINPPFLPWLVQPSVAVTSDSVSGSGACVRACSSLETRTRERASLARFA